MFYPLVSSGYLSLTDYNFVRDASPTFIGVDNFARAFRDPLFMTALRNTFVYGVSYFVAVILISLTIAMLLFRRLRLTRLYQAAVFMPIVVPLSLAGLIFVWILQPNYGLLNHVLGNLLGLPGLTRPWLSNGTTAMAAIVVLSLWATIGFLAILFLSGLQAIPEEMLEAAQVDGTTGWQRFVHVIIPSLKPTFAITGTWGVLHALKVFVEPMVLTDGGPGTSTLVLYQQTYITAFNHFDMGYASAMGYILGAIVLVLVGLNYVISMWRTDPDA